MDLKNLNVQELNIEEVKNVEGGEVSPSLSPIPPEAVIATMKSAKKLISEAAHEVGDFLRGFVDGLGTA